MAQSIWQDYGGADGCVGMAIWASVLEDWQPGDNNWLLDVIAPDQKTTTSVIANFIQVVKNGDLRMHPMVTRLVDAETLEKMGASQGNEPETIQE